VKKGSKSWGESAAKATIVVPVIIAVNWCINAIFFIDISDSLCLKTTPETVCGLGVKLGLAAFFLEMVTRDSWARQMTDVRPGAYCMSDLWLGMLFFFISFF